MNIRKPVDFSEMYASLDMAVAGKYAQMQMYAMIGQAVTSREEKGAAVAAAEYLQNRYPDMSGFSPRNLRRMRDFYRTYAQDSSLLDLALQIGWTQNVIILEADLTMQERKWYLEQINVCGWSKKQLTESIQNNILLADAPGKTEASCHTVDESMPAKMSNAESVICDLIAPAPGTIYSVSIFLYGKSVRLEIHSETKKFLLRQLRPPDSKGAGRHPRSILYLCEEIL